MHRKNNVKKVLASALLPPFMYFLQKLMKSQVLKAVVSNMGNHKGRA